MITSVHIDLDLNITLSGVTGLATLPASVPRLTREAAEVTAVAAASATSATGSGTSPGSAARRRTGATSATVGRLLVDVDGVTNPLIVCRNRTHCPQLQPGGGHLLQLQSGEAGVWF